MNHRRFFARGCLGLVTLGAAAVWAVQVKQPFVSAPASGALTYTPDAKGNRIPDFSMAGYGGGGVPLPIAPVRVVVSPVEGDNGPRIQAAIDYVAGLPADPRGLRGAVLLARGRYPVGGQLRIRASGVVLRGEGAGADGSVLVASGTDRRTLIEVAGKNDSRKVGVAVAVVDDYVPVGAIRLSVADAGGLQVGERVLIERPSAKEWIAALGMDDSPGRQGFQWQPGKMNLAWERIVTAVDGGRVTLDAPLTTAIDRDYGGGTVTKFTWSGRLSRVGVENLRCESAFDPANAKDESHAWMAISLDAIEHSWVANVTAKHFASSAVQLGSGARAVTVQDCTSLAPVSELGGYRRHSFHSMGQLTLFQRCRTEEGIHDFSVGYLAAGPNVFMDCVADRAQGFSGSIGSWASGVLFDNVAIDGSSLELDNRETWNQGVGWAAANSVLWNCQASVIRCRRPPTANNWAVGVWAEFWGDGWWDRVNEFVRPHSLYRAQLAARRGPGADAALAPLAWPAPPAAAPSLEAAVPDLAARVAPRPPAPGLPLALTQGWLTTGDALAAGGETGTNWWRGWLIPSRAGELNAALTRFVPGRSGPGLTDELDELTEAMRHRHEVVLRHHHGLWYDRRRDDHERVRRADGDSWPPFFEQPFARSGQGEAWDRLSRYDLTRYNPWYFGRLREFAGLARQKGLVLVNEMYFQHNILEAGAHWADFPWRPANSLQATGFPEPPPYVDSDGSEPPRPDYGKRIFMAEQFYDVTHPVRRAIHRAYIRQCLANLADEPNVIHTTSAEFSGPLHFVQFWLDVVAEWETETGRRPLIALSASKDVQDAILADARRAAAIDVIDLTYWFLTEDGKEFAPAGGTRMAPRQHRRAWRGGDPTGTSLAAMVHEYRSRFPAKAVITGHNRAEGWSFVAAGGSLPKLPASTNPALLAALPRMRPLPATVHGTSKTWALGEPGRQYFLYVALGGSVALDLSRDTGRFIVRRPDPKSGVFGPPADFVTAGGRVALSAPAGSPAIFWLTRE